MVIRISTPRADRRGRHAVREHNMRRVPLRSSPQQKTGATCSEHGSHHNRAEQPSPHLGLLKVRESFGEDVLDLL